MNRHLLFLFCAASIVHETLQVQWVIMNTPTHGGNPTKLVVSGNKLFQAARGQFGEGGAFVHDKWWHQLES